MKMCVKEGAAIRTEASNSKNKVIYDFDSLEYKTPSKAFLLFKRLFDIVGSLLSIIVLSPIFLIIAVLIKLEDGGKVIHTQQRICKEGDGYFTLYKFRTMKPGAENLEKWLSQEEIAEFKKEMKLENDPRITKCGSVLRTLSIDELPQLFNILTGTMSFIGPRPIVEEEKFNYGDKLSKFLDAKPGLTGNWQVNGRSNATYTSGQRQYLELYYVANRSFILDIKIFFKTFIVVIKKEGAL